MVTQARDILYTLYVLDGGDGDRMYKDIKDKRKLSADEMKQTPEGYVTIMDDDYPEGFRRTSNPPFVVKVDFGSVSTFKEGCKRVMCIACAPTYDGTQRYVFPSGSGFAMTDSKGNRLLQMSGFDAVKSAALCDCLLLGAKTDGTQADRYVKEALATGKDVAVEPTSFDRNSYIVRLMADGASLVYDEESFKSFIGE